jgi:hypothetical protein
LFCMQLILGHEMITIHTVPINSIDEPKI